jgi:prepilin-type processing-associated H-X9-DG protein
MSEERRDKRWSIKTLIRPLLVGLSCLFFILVVRIVLIFIPHTPDRWIMCKNNLRELCVAMHLYANDNDGMLPTPSKWCDLLIEYGNVTQKHFKCRGAEKGPCSYAMNRNLENTGSLNTIQAPQDIVCLFETYPGWNQVGDSEILTTANHKDKGCYVVFLDGHVAFMKTQNLHKLKWKPDEAQDE